MPQLWGECGLVKLHFMKIHIMLQALSSSQAYTDNLRIYEQIKIMEQSKLKMWRFHYRGNSDKEKILSITYLNLSECGGMKLRNLCNEGGAIATRQT